MTHVFNDAELQVESDNQVYITIVPVAEMIGKQVIVNSKDKKSFYVTLPVDVVKNEDELQAKEYILNELKNRNCSEIVGKWCLYF